MNTLKTVQLRLVELRIEEIISKENNRREYLISRFHHGLRYFLNSTTTLAEAEENLAFYINVYK